MRTSTLLSLLPLLLLTAGPVFAQEIDFDTPRMFLPVGLVADFNEDGFIDVAMLGSTLRIALGDGLGNYGPITEYPAGLRPRCMIDSDFNNDGDLDLVVAGDDRKEAWVFLGDGLGGFETLGPFVTRRWCHGAAAADFNEDGYPDLALVTNPGLSILLGDGTGTLGPPTHFDTELGHGEIAQEDFDRDGHEDVAILKWGSENLYVFPGNGSGGFDPEIVIPLGRPARSLVTLDLDEDGIADLVIGSQDHVDLYFGDGNGGFDLLRSYLIDGSGPLVFAADLNADGVQDLGAITPYDLAVLLGRGGGFFDPPQHFVSGGGHPVAADFNVDTHVDVCAGGWIVYGDGTGKFVSSSKSYVAPEDPLAVAHGDFDGDDHADLAVSSRTEESVVIFLGDGEAGMSLFGEHWVGRNALDLIVGDFDENGNPDLAVPVLSADDVSILLGDGAGGFFPAGRYPVGVRPLRIAMGDLDHDGHEDLVTVNPGSGDISVLLGDGTGMFGAATHYPSIHLPSRMTLGDFNEDSHLDLAVGNRFEIPEIGGREDERLSIFLGDGTGGFEEPYHFGANSAFAVLSGDFNEDGHLDLVVSNAFLPGDGAGGFGPGIPIPGAGGDYRVVADIDEDGHLDFACAYDDGVLIVRGHGDGTFDDVRYFLARGDVSGLTIQDFAEDGHLDIAVASREQSEISLLVNTTFGSFDVFLCKRGTVNKGADAVADVLFLNGDTGGASRTIEVLEGESIRAEMFLPPGAGDGRFVVHANYGEPLRATLTVLPKGIGLACFPFLIPRGASPAAIWNGTGKVQVAGESRYFDGSPLPDPEPAPFRFLDLPDGDSVYLPTGTTVTLQGVIVDPMSASHRQASATNAVILKVL